MKLFNFLALASCVALASCGGGSGDTLNSNETGQYVRTNELTQNLAVKTAGEDRQGEARLKQECDRLKELSESNTLTRVNVLNLEKNGTVRATYFNEYGLFDPSLEPLDVDEAFYNLGRIVIEDGLFIFKNTQVAFGKTTISDADEDQVITLNKSIQRTRVAFFKSETSESAESVNFTTDTVGSFGVEDRASFDYSKVNLNTLSDMVTTVQRYCLN